MPEIAKLDALKSELQKASSKRGERLPSPYPGLRPYLEDESRYFKGRETQTSEIIRRLARESCVAVLGGSGCGKSSIVRAGVIPALRLKQIPGCGDFWRVAICTPGRTPIDNLVASLKKQLDPESSMTDQGIRDILYGADGLGGFLPIFKNQVAIEPEMSADVRDKANLLILIDQFEELFRDENRGKPEVAALAELIVDFWRRRGSFPGLYLVLTMRTDDLHRCAEFINLPDVINATGYLTRRLKEEELRETIIAPVRPPLFRAGLLEGGSAPGAVDLRPYDVRVVTDLLDAVEEIAHDPDHLPLLQHLLAVLWRVTLERWCKEENAEPQITQKDLATALGFETWDALVQARDQEYAKGTRGWLLRHGLKHVAEQLYSGALFGDPLTPFQRETARCAFCLMGEVDDRGSFKRRWTSRQEIGNVAGGLGRSDKDVENFIRRFTLDHRLLWDRNNEIDVSHESLMRNWPRLGNWLTENRKAGRAYQMLGEHYEKCKKANEHRYRWLSWFKRKLSWFRRKNGFLSAENLDVIEPLLIRPRLHSLAWGLPKYNEFWAHRFLSATDRVTEAQVGNKTLNPENASDAEFGNRIDYLRWGIRKNLFRRLIPGAIVATFIIIVLFIAHQQYQYRVSVTQEKDRAENLVSFLLGEELLRKIRDAGLSELLEKVQKESETYISPPKTGSEAVSRNQGPVIAGLAQMNGGDLERIHGNTSNALTHYRAAEKIFGETDNDEGAKAGRARALSRVGDVLAGQGHLSEALAKHQSALKIRQERKKSNPEDIINAIELAESQGSIGRLQARVGNTSEAKVSLKQAMAQVMDYLFEAKSHETFKVSVYALKVFADSALNNADVFSPEDGSTIGLFDQALSLARDIVRESPFSAEGRETEAIALNWRANYAWDPSEALANYRKVNAAFDELLQWDPSNDPLRRQRAASQLLITEGILACLKDTRWQCDKPASGLWEAERLNLEAIKQMRILVDKDLGNMSWKSDLAWGLSDRARVLKEGKDRDGQIRALDESVVLYAQAVVDPRDVEGKLALATAYQNRAAALNGQKRIGDAIKDQQKARKILEDLAKEHPNDAFYQDRLAQAWETEIKFHRINHDNIAAETLERQKPNQQARHQEAEIKDDYQNETWIKQQTLALSAKAHGSQDKVIEAYRTGIKALNEAVAKEPKRAAVWDALAQAQKELASYLAEARQPTESEKVYREALDSALKAAELDPQNAEYQNKIGVVHTNIATMLNNSGNYDKSLQEFRASLQPLHNAQQLDPTKTQFYSDEDFAYDLMIETQEKIGQGKPQSPALLKQRKEDLRNVMLAAWRLVVWSPEGYKKHNYLDLAMARRKLALFIASENQQPQEAIELMDQARLDFERLVAMEPDNAEYHCHLGDSDYAIGRIRRGTGKNDGWEESIRKGLASIDHGISLNPKNIVCLKYSGFYHQYLGEQLILDGRSEAGRQELKRALTDYKKAKKISTEDKDIRNGIDEVMRAMGS